MFYSEDSASFFGGESEYWGEDVTGTGENEIESGGTVSEIGRDFPGTDSGGVIEGGYDTAGTGEFPGTGDGSPDGTIGGQAEEEKETSFLVEEENGKEELVDYIVSVLERIEDEKFNEPSEQAGEDTAVSSGGSSETAVESVYTIDDVYLLLSDIKTCCLAIQDDSKSYHVGQDITGRMIVAVLFMILGGIVIYAFVGRIR